MDLGCLRIKLKFAHLPPCFKNFQFSYDFECDECVRFLNADENSDQISVVPTIFKLKKAMTLDLTHHFAKSLK